MVFSSSKTLAVPAEDAVALEAKESLREWRAMLLELYVVSLTPGRLMIAWCCISDGLADSL